MGLFSLLKRLGAALAIIIVSAPVLRAADWPCYRGENGDAIIHESGLLAEWPAEGIKLVWKVPLRDDDRGTHAGPAVASGKVYVPGKNGIKDTLYCFNASTGQELWRCESAYDLPQRKEEWGTGIRSTPTVWDKFVFTLGCYGQLCCFDAETGRLVWLKDLPKEFKVTKEQLPPFGMAAAPLIAGGKLICQPGGAGASIMALEPATGKIIWQSGNDPASYAAPQLVTLCGAPQILAFAASGLVSVDLATGKELWRYDYAEEREKNICAPLAAGNMVYFSNNTLGFSALKISKSGESWKAERAWSARREKLHYCSPVMGDGCLYYHNSKGVFKCLALADGGIRWTVQDNFSELYGAMVRLTESLMLMLLDDGQAVLLDVSSETCVEKGRFKALERAFPQPAVAAGKLYVRDHENLFCYDLREKAAPGSTALAAKENKEKNAGATLFSWNSNRNRYFAGWLTGGVLALAGVLLLCRGRFLGGIAAAQSATLALACGMWADGMAAADWEWFHNGHCLLPLALAFTVVAALLTQSGWEKNGGGLRSKMSWAVLAAASLGLFVLSRSRLAQVDVGALISSAEIVDTRSMIGNIRGLGVFSIVFLAVLYWRVLQGGAGEGLERRVFDFAVSIWLGVVIGMSVRAAGAFFVLAYLLLPALVARQFRGGWLRQFLVALVLALAFITAGFFASQLHDQPPAQLAAGALTLASALFLLILWVFRTKSSIS